MSTTTPLERWVRTAIALQIQLNEALANISVLSGAGSVDPDEIIAEAAAPLESAKEITDEHIAQVIAELRRQNEAQLAKVAEAMGIISCVRVMLPPDEGTL